MACMCAILQRKDTRYVWTGGMKYNIKDNTLSPNSRYDPVHDNAKIKYFMSAGKDIEFPSDVGILDPIEKKMLTVSYNDWYMSLI